MIVPTATPGFENVQTPWAGRARPKALRNKSSGRAWCRVQPGMHRAAFEVDRYGFKHIGAKLFPCLRFGEDAVAQRARAITAFLGVANLEDQLHALRIPEGAVNGISEPSLRSAGNAMMATCSSSNALLSIPKSWAESPASEACV